MVLPDVNVLVYAHRRDVPRHDDYRDWIAEMANGRAAFGLSDQVLAGFVRVVTHPRVFARPTPLGGALAFVEGLRGAPQRVAVAPGPRHFSLFAQLCREAEARGNLVPDAWFAALAIESGCEWITTDRDFARFPGLSWRHPLR